MQILLIFQITCLITIIVQNIIKIKAIKEQRKELNIMFRETGKLIRNSKDV